MFWYDSCCICSELGGQLEKVCTNAQQKEKTEIAVQHVNVNWIYSLYPVHAAIILQPKSIHISWFQEIVSVSDSDLGFQNLKDICLLNLKLNNQPHLFKIVTIKVKTFHPEWCCKNWPWNRKMLLVDVIISSFQLILPPKTSKPGKCWIFCL